MVEERFDSYRLADVLSIEPLPKTQNVVIRPDLKNPNSSPANMYSQQYENEEIFSIPNSTIAKYA